MPLAGFLQIFKLFFPGNVPLKTLLAYTKSVNNVSALKYRSGNAIPEV